MLHAVASQSLAEQVVRDGFKQFERTLKRQNICSPIRAGVDVLYPYGTSLNPDLVLAFYTDSGNLTHQASECYTSDEEAVGDAWQTYKRFIRSGGHRMTADQRADPYSAVATVVGFCDKSSIEIINDRAAGLPMLRVLNWQSGLVDLHELKEVDDMEFYFENCLQRIGYRRHYNQNLPDIGRLFHHSDADMSPVLIDWSNQDVVKMLIFPLHEEARRVELTRPLLSSYQQPVIDLRRQPDQFGIYSHEA